MNKHMLLNNFTASIGTMVARKKKFFVKSIASNSFEENINSLELKMPSIDREGAFDVPARTLMGMLDPAFCVAKWKGKDYPTVIYHHGNNERPFDFKKTAKNTFYNIFINTKDKVDANLIVVRAPFHNNSLKQYQNSMVNLSNFTAMIATSVKLNEEIIKEIRRISSEPIITTGISLGGWVTNLHRAIYNTSTAYAPLMAGAFLGELFLKSKYRKMVSDIALNNPEEIRSMLNFDDLFKERVKSSILCRQTKYISIIFAHTLLLGTHLMPSGCYSILG
ncbi:MAG: hypothetical protein ACLFNU_10070 [Bacteroidales bacterium]